MSTLTKSMAEKSVTVRQKLTTVSITLPDSDLNIFQQFLHRWHKLRFMSAPLNIRCLLHRQDNAIFMKVKSVITTP